MKDYPLLRAFLETAVDLALFQFIMSRTLSKKDSDDQAADCSVPALNAAPAGC